MAIGVDDDQRGGDAHLAVELQETRDRHMLSVRDLAGRWEQGLRGLLGVAGASGLIGAPLAAERLNTTTQALVGVLLGAVLATAAGGLGLVMSAAYGSARLEREPATATERAALRWALAERARRRLRWGRALALASLGLFAVTITVAWIEPGTDTAANLRVETTTGVIYCGPLLDAPPGVIAVHTSSEGRVDVPARTVAAIGTTAHCAKAQP